MSYYTLVNLTGAGMFEWSRHKITIAFERQIKFNIDLYAYKIFKFKKAPGDVKGNGE